ncbi:MAG: spermidine/putrescine ABC transporter substrate-binding protein [Clostridiales bacterium]|nr:spermidine/putrescine ABC transporter substrate-binding protein [Clostridiales bacterium]
MKKKKYAALALGGLLTISGILAGCGANGAKENAGSNVQSTEAGNAAEENQAASGLEGTSLNLYTWDGMFPQEVLDGFEKETGIKINYSNFDYGEDMLAKLQETNGGDYDFVIVDDYILEMIREQGLAQDLNTAKLANWGNINPIYQSQFYDPDNKFTVPYGAGIPLIVYDPALVDIEIKGYGDLWDASLADNVALIANYRVINGIALKTMGESFNTEDLDVIQAAGDKLLELAPNVRVINDSNTQDYLITGEVGAAFLYSSQVSAALMAREDLAVVYPEEGLGFGIMGGFIPSNAPNAEAAYAFIDYLLDAEVSAKCFEYIGYYCTNKAAEAFISDEMKDLIVLPEGAAQGESIQNVSQEAEDLHGEIWNQFKNACN